MEKMLENISFNGFGLFVSFLGGLISFFSPCILPLIPAYFSFLLGSSIEDIEKGKKHLYVSVAFLCLGFTIVFVLLGSSATGIGKFLSSHISFFRIVAGIVILVFALEALELIKIFRFHTSISLPFNKAPAGLNAIFFGAALGISWTPCVGYILGAILTMASTQETVAKGTLMLFLYSAGLSIPFFLFAIFFKKLRKFQNLIMVHSRKIKIFAGVVLLIFAFYLLY